MHFCDPTYVITAVTLKQASHVLARIGDYHKEHFVIINHWKSNAQRIYATCNRASSML